MKNMNMSTKVGRKYREALHSRQSGRVAGLFVMGLLLAGILLPGGVTPAYAAPNYDKVAKPYETGGTEEVGQYGMLPVYGRDIKDGTYSIEGESSSSFFKIDTSELTVSDGKLTVSMNVPSSSYKFVYMGTAEEAAAAPIEDYIEPKNRAGVSTYEIPIDALNKGIPCAAFSKRKKKWYDRTILFDASSLPEDALLIELPDYDKISEAIALYDQMYGTDDEVSTDGIAASASATSGTSSGAQTETGAQSGSSTQEENGTQADNSVQSGNSSTTGTAGQENPATVSAEPIDIDLDDGTYAIQVNMTGGSGRASVSSPTWLVVENGKAYARLLWSSSYYDYMLVGGKKYLNESEDGGNSTFTIPITAMDEPMAVVGDTTAMGDPVAIDYKLTFYEDSIGPKSQIPQEAAIDVLILAVIIIGAGGVLNYFLKKKRKA